MGQYIVRRLLLAVPVWFTVVVFIFVIVRLLPGNPILDQIGASQSVTPDQIKFFEHQMGLDKPIYVQFLIWMKGVMTLDLGKSLLNPSDSVAGRILVALPVTLELMILSVLVGLLISIPVGILSAIRQDSVTDYGGRLFCVFGLSVPEFVTATLAVTFPAIWFHYHAPLNPISFWSDPVGNLKQFGLPAVVLGYRLSATVARLLRSTMLEVLRSDYIRTAYAKGLTERTMIVRHALKNALVPVVTIVGTQIAFLLGGNVIAENVFNLPGLGNLALTSILHFDYPQIQAIVMLTATFVISTNLFVDLLYAWLDPRIRYG